MGIDGGATNTGKLLLRRPSISVDLSKAIGKIATEPSASDPFAHPEGASLKVAAIDRVIRELEAPVSNIISNFCSSLNITSTIGIPPTRSLIRTEKNWGLLSLEQDFVGSGADLSLASTKLDS